MRTTICHLVLIVLAVWGVYGQTVESQFVHWDDYLLIRQNPHLVDGKLDGLIWHWEHAHERLYVPVVYTAWWCLAATFGMNAMAFHAANLLIFSAAACMAYAILRMLIGQPWPALAGALLLALHPLQVDAVAWATGMKDVLCLFFCLAAMALYLRPGLYWAATICFAAAMLCKPEATTVPLILTVIDWFVLRRPLRRTLCRTIPWLAGAACMAVVTVWFQPPVQGLGGPLWARPLVALDAINWYLLKLVLPIGLAIDQGRRPYVVLSSHVMGIPWVALVWIVPAALAAGLARLRRPALTAAALIFLLALLPVLGLESFVFKQY